MMLRKASRLVIAVAGAAGVLLLGAWAGGGFAGAGAATSGRAPRATAGGDYPQMADGEIPVGDSLVVNGQPMQLSLFVTDDPPVKVIEFYRSAFAARHLFPLGQADDKLGHVSVFDPEDGYQRSITALPQHDNKTLVLVSVTNPRKPPRFTRAHASMPFPVPEEQRGFLGYESKDGGTRAQNGQFSCAMAAPDALRWYRQKLASEGYAENLDGQPAGSVATFVRRDATITVAVQALGDKSGSMVFVNRIEGAEL